MKWQPIETAPKDRTGVIGYFPKTNPRWGKPRGPYILTCWFEPSIWFNKGGWMTGVQSMNYREPTHWMPLPEPPQEGE